MPEIVLASSSPYRRALLEKLGLPFIADSPEVDESALDNEAAKELVARLSCAKTDALRDKYGKNLIIGSDQVAVLDRQILTKPHTMARAREQLRKASGKTVTFFTGLCLLNSANGSRQCKVIPYTVTFRELSASRIENYLNKEKPLDCAGSFKSEGLGITLFEGFQGEDPNALVGLPLMELTSMLINEGVDPLG